MSKSYRKPYVNPCSRNPAKDRAAGRRRMRHIANMAMRQINCGADPEEVLFPERNEVDNPWDWNVDGKQEYAGDHDKLEQITRK